MSRSAGSIWLTTRPPMSISPPVMVSSPATMRSSVDLPQPEGPTSTQNWPSPASKSMPLIASKTQTKGLRTLRRVTLAMGTLLLRLDQAAHEQALHEHDDRDRRQHREDGGRHRELPFGQLVGRRQHLLDAGDDGLHRILRGD